MRNKNLPEEKRRLPKSERLATAILLNLSTNQKDIIECAVEMLNRDSINKVTISGFIREAVITRAAAIIEGKC